MYSKHGKNRDQVRQQKLAERKAFDAEVDAINERINEIEKNNYIDPNVTEEFASLPILESTKAALAKNKFVKMSEIQKQTLLYSLSGRDVIGAAETGSGKTLAFAIPVVELLKKEKFSKLSGIGAIVISPTRDLAAQTNEVFKKLCKDTDLSVGLITGGMDFEMEKEGLRKLNIIICTMGRLLEHMGESETFNSDHLRVLVLDEADKLMNKDFAKDLRNVLSELTSADSDYHQDKRIQILLFTATANKNLKDITKGNLQRPVRVDLTEHTATVTPEHLIQYYTEVPLSQKWNTLYSFLASHRDEKIIVFMETVKMVRFAFESFRHLRPGIPILHITGKQNSDLRFEVLKEFKRQKRCAIFTTDVTARGLDFPDITWVVQMDCPSSTETYIHRVGRTARFHKTGRSILFLTPSEKSGMIEKLNKAKVQPQGINISGDMLFDIRPRLVDILAQFSDIKHLAMKAITTYVRSVQHHQDGVVFKVQDIINELDDFTKSFGLLSTPVMKKKGSANDESESESESSDSESSETEDKVDESYFEIIEDDDDVSSLESNKPKPTTMEFLDPSIPIPEQEYTQWREHLKNLLVSDKPKKQKKQKQRKEKVEEGEEEASEEKETKQPKEEKKEVTLEEAAANLLFDDL